MEVFGIVKMTKPIIRKVTCVLGKFDNKSDFVLEPVCSDDKCEVCKDAFYIMKVEDDNHKPRTAK